MRPTIFSTASAIILVLLGTSGCAVTGTGEHSKHTSSVDSKDSIQVGARPYVLVKDMDEGTLKKRLESCANNTFRRTEFSIGHRGAPLRYPEHTRESYLAAAQGGAGILECDVTFTRDKALVCRHSQCDLHTTTNILQTPLAGKCSIPFQPAIIDRKTGKTLTPAKARCCTSDITLAEFKTLKGKMDTANPNATSINDYVSPASSRNVQTITTNGTLLSHSESIALFKTLGVKMMPELKRPQVPMPYRGAYSQEQYAQQMIDEYKKAGVAPENVFPQSFSISDVQYWIENEARFGSQAVYLDGRFVDSDFNHTVPTTWSPTMDELVERGIKIIAPPMWMLVELDENNRIIPSAYARAAKSAGLEIFTWTLERSGSLVNGGGWYYQSIQSVTNNDGDTYQVLHVLAKDVGIRGIFTDWPATVTYYANCLGI
jgi:glycerophosphoryl diester phosphodiesterase